MSKSNERSPQISRIHIGTIATSAGFSTGIVVPGLYFRKHARIKKVYYADTSNIAASGSNHLVVKLQDNFSTPVVYASADTSAAAVVAGTQYAMAFVKAEADNSGQAASAELDVPADTMLNVSIQGLGTAVPTNACIIIEHYPL